MKPTESELEILLIMWNLGECTVRSVHEELTKLKDVGYTSTLKLMQNMHEKGFVSRSEDSRSHLYKAVFTKGQAQDSAVHKMINTVFGGSTTDLIIRALGQHNATIEELDVLTEYLKNLTDKNKSI